jgi:hypothetical protein
MAIRGQKRLEFQGGHLNQITLIKIELYHRSEPINVGKMVTFLETGLEIRIFKNKSQ